jgi:hypothetical protein
MRFNRLKRREFIAVLGGAAVAWPLGARAQADRVRQIGVLMAHAESDPGGVTAGQKLDQREDLP